MADPLLHHLLDAGAHAGPFMLAVNGHTHRVDHEAAESSNGLSRIFLRDGDGRRPALGGLVAKLLQQGGEGLTSDIGKAAVWLASDDADYVHGTTLFVDGGMTLYPGFEGNG